MRASPLAWAVVAAAGLVAAAACDACAATPATSDPALDGATLDGAADANAPPDTTDASPGPHVMLPTVLAAGLGEPRGLVLIGDELYVAEHGAGRIVAVPRAGGAARVVAPGLKGPFRLATDGSSLVASEREAGNVLAIDLGGRVTVLASGVAQPGEVGVSHGEAFWLEAGGDAGTGALWRASLDGGTPQVLAGGITRASGLAVGASRAYVTADAFSGTKGNVFAPALAGDEADASDGDAAPPATPLATMPDIALGIASDEGAGVVYWAARKGTSTGASEGFIRRTPLDGGKTDALTEAPYGADRVVVHQGYVYFTNYQALARVPVGGGPREDLALHTSVGDLVVTDGAVYWTDADAGKLYALWLGGPPSGSK